MKGYFVAIALAAGLSAMPAAAGSWDHGGFYPQMQGFKGRQGPGPGYERGEAERESRRERRMEREERREQFTEDERRALHRDLDKANRELYRRRQ